MKCVRLFLNNGFVTDERSSTTWQEYEIYDLDKKLKTTSIISLTKIFLVIFFFFFFFFYYLAILHLSYWLERVYSIKVFTWFLDKKLSFYIVWVCIYLNIEKKNTY